MTGMIADYMHNGVDMHNAFIVGLADQEAAVQFLAAKLRREGENVQYITVVLGWHTLAELEDMADNGIPPGVVACLYDLTE